MQFTFFGKASKGEEGGEEEGEGEGDGEGEEEREGDVSVTFNSKRILTV